MKIKVGNVEKEMKLMNQLFHQNNNSEVVIRGQILIKTFPNIIPFYNILGLTYKKIGKQKEAINVLKSGLFQDQNAISVLTNLADLYRETFKLKEAEELLTKSLKLDNKDIYGLISYGKLKTTQGKFLEAIKYFKKASEIKYNFDDVIVRIGSCYLSINDFENAKKYFEKAVYSKSENLGVHFSYSQMIDYSKDKKHQDYMLKKLEEKDLDETIKGPLYFAIAKSFSDQKNYKEESKFLKLGNDSINTTIISNKILNKEKRELDELKSIFADFNFENILIKKNIFSKNIIFVVGLPRSGTTLTHQIIASHSKVKGVGETNVLHSYFTPNIKNNILKEKLFSNGKLNEDFISELSLKLSKNYEYFSKEKIIVDKSPFNFWWLGFIKILFPNAKIIHLNRNLKDTVFSIYRSLFGTRKMDWSYNQKNIIDYTKIYIETMNFWRKKFPDFIYELSYESLVSNQKKESEQLIEFCDLKWEEQCLEFYNSATAIHTMSIYQTRKPIYKSSININEKYTEFSDFFKKIDNL